MTEALPILENFLKTFSVGTFHRIIIVPEIVTLDADYSPPLLQILIARGFDMTVQNDGTISLSKTMKGEDNVKIVFHINLT